ncbi:MAG TPA: hypothetical protein VFN11_01415, partial [Ktedonobacterales bacterium]|nr:hypothetical protein [Ktedonobacterales bacterium]
MPPTSYRLGLSAERLLWEARVCSKRLYSPPSSRYLAKAGGFCYASDRGLQTYGRGGQSKAMDKAW